MNIESQPPQLGTEPAGVFLWGDDQDDYRACLSEAFAVTTGIEL
jgi:hypothetical protein